MFEIPNGRSVRRADLDSDASREGSPDDDAAAAAAFLANFAPTFALPPSDIHATDVPLPTNVPHPAPQTEATAAARLAAEAETKGQAEAEADPGFSLFSTNTTLALPQVHTTNTPAGLHTSTPPPLPTCLTTSNTSALLPRPEAYYLAAPASPTTLSRFRSASISATTIRHLASLSSPGLFLPWRSFTFPAHTRNLAPQKRTTHTVTTTPADDEDTERSRHRTRAGKKTRIKLRRKHEASRAARAAREAAERDKAAHEREKRARVNRAKQLKKRERARIARAEAGDGAGGAADEGQGDD